MQHLRTDCVLLEVKRPAVFVGLIIEWVKATIDNGRRDGHELKTNLSGNANNVQTVCLRWDGKNTNILLL